MQHAHLVDRDHGFFISEILHAHLGAGCHRVGRVQGDFIGDVAFGAVYVNSLDRKSAAVEFVSVVIIGFGGRGYAEGFDPVNRQLKRL